MYDEENDLRLLNSCLCSGNYSRLMSALEDDCVYISGHGEVRGRNKEDVYAALEHVAVVQKEKEIKQLTKLAYLEEPLDDKYGYRPGKRGIALQQSDQEELSGMMYITTNEAGKITLIETNKKSARIKLNAALTQSESLREKIRKYCDRDVPISGGFGTSYEDAIVFEPVFDAVEWECFIVNILFNGKGRVLMQVLAHDNGRSYDILKVHVDGDPEDKNREIYFDITEHMKM